MSTVSLARGWVVAIAGLALSSQILGAEPSVEAPGSPSPTSPPSAGQVPSSLEDGLTPYQRFVIFPRIEKGLEEQRRGNHAAAVAQFERARALAPQSVLTALYLAYAFRRLGDRARASRVLEEQRQFTPESPQLAAAIADDAPWLPPPLSSEELERRRREEAAERRARLDYERRQEIMDRTAAVRQRIRDGRLNEAADMADASFPSYTTIRADLDRDLIQRAIFLQAWASAHAAFERIDRAGMLTASDARQWMQILLARGDTSAARGLLGRPGLQGVEDTLVLARALQQRGDGVALRSLLGVRRPRFESAAQEGEWLRLTADAFPNEPAAIAAQQPQFEINRDLYASLVLPGLMSQGRYDEAERALALLPPDKWKDQRLALALARGDRAAASRLGAELVRDRQHDLATLDQVTYQLVRLGDLTRAAELLIAAWPFGSSTDPTREQLTSRLVGLANERASLIPPDAREKLAEPLPDAAMREYQASLFSILGDCNAVRRLLGDFAAEYRAQSLTRLAECYGDTAPGLAQYAYAEALRRDPSAQNRRALAYQAHAAQDYAAASAAWAEFDARALGPEHTLAAAASAAALGDEVSLRRWLDRYEAAGYRTEDDRYWWWRARLAREREPARSLAAVRRAIAIRPLANYYQFEADLLRRSGDRAGARAALEKAVALMPEDPGLLASLAFAEADAGQPARAADLLQRASAAQPDNLTVKEQLTYLRQQLGDAPGARRQAREVIDDLNGYPATELTDSQRDRAYAFRRLHENLGRRWTFLADAWVGNNLAYASRSASPGQAYRSYSQIEVDYRLGAAPVSGASSLSLFGRVFASSAPGKSVLPVHDPTLGAGLRWKPFADRVLFLAVEPQLPLEGGSSRDPDVLLRASASFLNAGRYSDDWHPSGRGWFARNLYLDLAHFVRDERTALTADLRGSYHRKLAEGRTLEPFTRVQYNGLWRAEPDGFDKDIRAGLGLRLNLWSGDNRYDAYPTRTYVGIEFQHAFRSYLDERNVVLFMIGGRW